MINETSGFISQTGTLEFSFEMFEYEENEYWRLTEWKDFSINKGTESASLGEIFAYFYANDPLDIG